MSQLNLEMNWKESFEVLFALEKETLRQMRAFMVLRDAGVQDGAAQTLLGAKATGSVLVRVRELRRAA